MAGLVAAAEALASDGLARAESLALVEGDASQDQPEQPTPQPWWR